MVEHDGAGREGAQGRCPVIGDGIDFAIAVELVTEQVMQDHEARLGFTHDLRQGGFVAFKQGHIIRHPATPISTHQRSGGDARGQISPRTIVEHAPPGSSQAIGNHAGGGGFAVGTGHTNHPTRQLPRQVGQHIWRYAPGNHPWHGGTTTTPQQSAQQSSQPPQPNRHHIAHHTDTLR